MNKILEIITVELENAFEAAGFDKSFAKVSISNRPDLCEYQCNGAMALAKQQKTAPINVANAVVEKLAGNEVFAEVQAVMPGFINLKVSDTFLAAYVNEMSKSEKFGLKMPEKPQTIIVDYGGANVAKPLHVGHLRPAVIGESVKRICKYAGNNVIGDAHLGDWGLQMGDVIEEVKDRKPDLPYFDPTFTGEYPEEAPFTISELEEIYPCASAKSKVDEAFAARCHEATVKLQKGDRAYRALWQHIVNVSKKDLEKNYNNLDVHFELWLGESDADPYVEDMLDKMVKEGIAHESQGALVVDIAEPDDKKEYPPCIVRKSDGAAIYETTDLATLIQREQDYHPDKIIYVVDKRQDLHFLQVFRAARKAGIVRPETELRFIGNGTMNGKDGKPFKTREGGVLRLERLIADVSDAVYTRIMENREETEEQARETAKIVGLAALKYGDLSNAATKDYCFDIERFTSFEGNTGPYILYTMVRIKSILAKYKEKYATEAEGDITSVTNASMKTLMLTITKFHDCIEGAFAETAPHKVCQFVYELSDCFNGFYHETKILAEENEEYRKSYIALLKLTLSVLEDSIDMLGFSAPDRM